MPRTVWIIFAAALLALAAGPLEIKQEGARPLVAADEALDQRSTPISAPPVSNSGFVAGGVYPITRMDEIPDALPTYGSWLGSDEFRGRYEGPWLRAEPAVMLLIAGYPNQPGNTLELEVRSSAGAITRVPFAEPNPREKWQRWYPKFPNDVVSVRVVAVDGTTAFGGWLACSEPFVACAPLGGQLWACMRLIAITCLVLVLLFGPGLLWFQRKERPLSALTLAILIGPLLLVALGLLCWSLGKWIAPATSARSGLGLLLAGIGWQAWRIRHAWTLPREVGAVLGASALLAGFAVAKSTYSGGPAGELFRGTIARTLSASGHSDSWISYQVAQLVAHNLSPFGREAEQFFNPWSFGSRGPLAGLAAAPVMLATGAKPPRYTLPDDRWRPFDAEGYATYRVAMIGLASLAGLALFGAVATWASPAWALFASALGLLAPFYVHELYFTWPKLFTAGLVLTAFVLANRGRALGSGIVLGVGYLFHPLALLSAPFLALWLLVRAEAPEGGRRWAAPFICAAGVLLLVVPWQIIGRWSPGEGATQSVFLSYFDRADNAPAHWSSAAWWQSRWDNFANTFIPGYLLGGDPAHESVNSYYGPSDAWLRRSFLWWNTLPFALGLPAFAVAALVIASACRRALSVVLVTFLLPTIFLIVYWGAASTGLMRHCGHVLFVTTLVLAGWSLSRWDTPWRRRATAFLLHPACFAWRGAEIALMAFGTTFLHQPLRPRTAFAWSDLFSVALGAACLTWAVVLLAKTARPQRGNLFP